MIFITCVCIELLHHCWIFVVVVESSQESWFPIKHRHDSTLSWLAGAALDQPPQTYKIGNSTFFLSSEYALQMRTDDWQKLFNVYCDSE